MPDKVITENDEIRRFIQLHHKVDKKNPKAEDLEEFRRGLMKYPGLLVTFGDMARQAEFRLIEGLSVPKSSQEAMQLQLQNIKRDLGYSTAPPLEKMLIEQVGLCWLRLSIVELKHAINTSGSSGIARADYWDRALSAAQRRHLRAVETLARVRRLLRPNAVQVNIGAQQVNVANMGKKDAE
jgi:hypothetical protein